MLPAQFSDIAETAKANNLKAYDYFLYLLDEIPKHMGQKDRTFLENLSPWSKKFPKGRHTNLANAAIPLL